MKNILSILIITMGLTMFTGCSETTTNTQVVSSKVEKIELSSEYVKETTEWCYKILEQRDAILMGVQLKPKETTKIVDSMIKASAASIAVGKAGGHPQLEEVLFLIGSAGYDLNLYMASNGGKAYMRATQYFEDAIKIVGVSK